MAIHFDTERVAFLILVFFLAFVATHLTCVLPSLFLRFWCWLFSGEKSPLVIPSLLLILRPVSGKNKSGNKQDDIEQRGREAPSLEENVDKGTSHVMPLLDERQKEQWHTPDEGAAATLATKPDSCHRASIPETPMIEPQSPPPGTLTPLGNDLFLETPASEQQSPRPGYEMAERECADLSPSARELLSLPQHPGDVSDRPQHPGALRAAGSLRSSFLQLIRESDAVSVNHEELSASQQSAVDFLREQINNDFDSFISSTRLEIMTPPARSPRTLPGDTISVADVYWHQQEQTR